MPSKFLRWILAGSLVVAGSAGCDVNVRDGKASFNLLTAQATADWTHRYPLTAGARVEIVNISGPVRLTSGEPGTVEVHATITAKALTDAGAADLLSKGAIQERAGQGRVHIETMMPRGVHGSYEVQYDVRVPRDAETETSVTNGSLKVTGLDGRLKTIAVNSKVELNDMAGAIDSVVANGSLLVTLARVTADVRLETTNGRLSLELPATSKAQLTARVVNGSLEISGLPIEQPAGRRIRNVEATLNGGGPSIDVRATNGRATIIGK